MSDLRIAQVVYNADTGKIEFRVPLEDGTGDHVLATVKVTSPPPDEDA
jgi:hypothetical protein